MTRGLESKWIFMNLHFFKPHTSPKGPFVCLRLCFWVKGELEDINQSFVMGVIEEMNAGEWP